MVAAQFGIARRVLVPLIALAVGQVGQVGQPALARLPSVPRPSHLSAVVGQLMRRFVPRRDCLRQPPLPCTGYRG